MFLTDIKATLGRRIRQHRGYRQTLVELDRLSERELNDLGITRHDIRNVARSVSSSL